jgi:hypothetical protein
MPAKRRLADARESALIVAMATAIGNHVFSGQSPPVIGAVLADLMSTFLLNHCVPNDLIRQAQIREEILTEWCVTVRGLVDLETDPPASETLQ